MSRKFLNMLFAVQIFLLIPVLALASNGKLSGKVVDRETGDPLPGANVVVEGTTLGAATNVNGEYFILNVPAGVYTLKAAFIGYRDVSISNVKVSFDLTTGIDFELPSEALEVSEIAIVAERPLVNKSATNAVRITSAEEFEKLPIRGTQAIYALEPGVVVQNNEVYIRGGRKDEVGFMLEGANARNINTGGNAIAVIPEALEEAQIQAGGYNAEFGGANAGIISQTFRSGTPDFHFRLQAETDQSPGSNLGEKTFDTYNYGYEDYVLTLSGPVYKNKIKAFVALERETFDDSRRVFWNGFSIQDVVGAAVARDSSILQNQSQWVRINPATGKLEVTDGGGFGGTAGEVLPDYSITPGNINDTSKRHTLNATVNFDYNPILLRLSAASTFVKDAIVGNRPALALLSRDGVSESSTNLFTAKLTHLLSNTTFYEVSVNYFDGRQKRYDPAFGDNYLAYGDSLAYDRAFGSTVSSQWRTRQQGPASYDIFQFPIFKPGQRAAAFRKNQQNYISANLDFTTQYNAHAIKFGGSYEKWSTRLLNALGTTTQYQFLRSRPDLARAIKAGPNDPLYETALLRFRRTGNINAYGYDVFGNEVDNDSDLNDGTKGPTFGAVYVQDKFEAGDLVVNAGLRLDYFDFDQQIPADLKNPQFDPDTRNIPLSDLKDQGTSTQISPRLGFAFPVTDRTVFHVQYGRFVQAPQFINVYSGRGQQGLVFSGGNFVFNPGIASKLDPIKTIQYEIGFNQAFTDFASFDMTAFYRDVKGQLQIVNQEVDTQVSAARSYQVFQNQDFATTKGLEIALNIRRTERVAASLNYTFSDAQSTGSFPNSSIGATQLSDPVPTVVAPVDFTQRHRGSIAFDYRFGKGDGGPVLERSGLNLLYTFNSGHPYTRSGGGIAQQGPDTGGILNNVDPRGRTALENIGASTTPWVSNLDLRIDKTVTLGPVDANFYIYAQNLLNTKNILNVYQRTGNAVDDGFLTNPDLSAKIVQGLGPAYVDLYKVINLQDRQHWWDNNLGSVTNSGLDSDNGSSFDLFGRPREVRFGVSIEY